VRTQLLAMLGAAALLPQGALASSFAVPEMDADDAFAIRVAAEHSRSSAGHEWAVPNVELIAPLAPGLEGAVSVGRGHVHQSGARAFNGMTDLAIEMKWELLPVPDDGGFGITVVPALLVPLGNRNVTEDDWRVELPVVFGWRQGPLTLHAMTGYSASRSDRGDAIPFGTLVTYDLGESLTLGAEFVGSAPINDLDGYEAEIGAGVEYEVAEGWALQGRVGRVVRVAGEPNSTNFLLAIEKAF
jgi:hypothetical protein